MSNEVLYLLLPGYAAHEAVYLSQAIASDEFALKENPKYVSAGQQLYLIRLCRLSGMLLKKGRLSVLYVMQLHLWQSMDF